MREKLVIVKALKYFPNFCLRCMLVAVFTVTAYAAESSSPNLQDMHCVVMPSAVVDVTSGVSGRVKSIGVERGDKVLAGQAIAVLESGVERANLELAKERATLDTNVLLQQARLEFEQRKVKRTEKLLTSKAISAHVQDEAKTEAELAGWHLRQAEDERNLAQLEMTRAEEMLKRRSVISPIDGIVVERFKWPGEYVKDEPVIQVVRLDPLWVEVVAPISLYGKIQKNMIAEVFSETPLQEKRKARVLVVDPIADAASGTFRVRLELPNPDLSILGGVRCKARFPDISPVALASGVAG